MPSLQFDSVMLVKLLSGESVVCQVPEYDDDPALVERLTIYYPMQVLEIETDLSEGESSYLMAPWIPFAADQKMQLNRRAIILAVYVHDDIALKYSERVDVFIHGEVEEVFMQPVRMGRRNCTHTWDVSEPCDESQSDPV